MTRRKSKNESALLGIAILAGGSVWVVNKITDTVGLATLITIPSLLVACVVFYLVRKRAARLAYLRGKYGDEMIVQRIMRQQFWEGETVEQLQDSLGNAPSVDRDLLKSKKREVWKYLPNGKGRYRLRITLDQDVVVGVKTTGQ